MKNQKILIAALLTAALGSCPAFGQNAIIEQARIGSGTQKNNTDFTYAGFVTTVTSDHSSAPGLVSGVSTGSRFASLGAPPVGAGTNVTISPNGGSATISNSTSAGSLQIGTTYLVSVSFGSSPTAASSDIVVSCSDTGMSGIDTFNGITTTAFQAGSGYNKWNPVGYITPGVASPTIKFTYSSGTNGRWNVDSFLFSPIQPPPGGTYQYWNTGSPGGSGTWDTGTPNWNTAANGSGTQGVYTQGDIADFNGTAGIVTVTGGGITVDGGLQFDTTGYTVTGGALTLGSSPSTTGTNISVAPGATATINSVLTGSYGWCSAYLGTLILGAPNTVNGTATIVTGGKVVLGTSQMFTSLAGTGGLNLSNNTLTVGSDNASTAFTGIISDGGPGSPGALVKTGTGTLSLGGANTLSGTTTINQGTISVTADASLGAAPSSLVANQLTLNGGALFSAGSSLTVNAKRGITLIGNNNVIAANTVNRTITLLSPITGSGGVTIPTGFIEFDNNANTFAGDLVFALTNNVSARFESNNCAGAGRIHIMPQITTGNDPITLRNDLAVNTTVTNAIFYDESITNGAGYYMAAYLNTTNVGKITFSGNITGTATGGVTINDSSSGTSGGTVVLSGDNSGFKSAFNLEGGTLMVGSPTALGPEFVVRGGGSTATPNLQAAVPLTGANALTNVTYFNLANGFDISGNNDLELAGPIHIGAGGGLTLELDNTGTTTFSGPVDDQGLGLAFTLQSSGSSLLVLKGSNSFSGGITVYSGQLDGNVPHSVPGNVTMYNGVLQLDSPNAMSPTASLTVYGATVNLNFNGFQTNASFFLGGTGYLPYGTYGANTNNPNNLFTGNGYLVVSPNFVITSQSFDTNNNMVVCWQSTPGYNYDVLTNFNLTQPTSWTPANGSVISATNTTTCFTVPGGNTNVFVLIRADNVTP